MARFDASGLDAVIEEMKMLGELTGATADKMLMAGAEAVKQEWAAEASRRQFRDTGAMISSIGYPKKPKTVKQIRVIDIYPQGKDGRGVRNAEKAFILHWGTTGARAQKRRKKKKMKGAGIPRTLWIDDADKNSESRVQEAFEKIWNDFIRER